MVRLIDTAPALTNWLTECDVEGLDLGGSAPDFNGPRRIEGRRGTRRETVTVPAHIFAAVSADLVWMHDANANLPNGVLFALRGKLAESTVTSPAEALAPAALPSAT